MSGNWREYKLADLGEIITGRTPPSSRPECFGDEFPFITPSDMNDQKRAVTTDRYLSSDGAELLKRNLLPAESVAVSCIGWQMGKAIMTTRPSFTNQQLNTIIPNETIEPDFLYYTLVTWRERLLSLGAATGVRTPILNKTAFSELEIPVPPLPTQRKIAAVLSAYDDLIENNSRRIAVLEEMARRIYREWFVHYRYPGHQSVPLVEVDGFGPVPVGWEVVNVKDIVNRFKAGNVYRQKTVKNSGQVPVIDQSTDEVLGYHDNKPDHFALPEKPIIIFGDHTCKMQLMVQPFSIGPNVVPFVAKENIPVLYLYFVVENLVETREYKRHWTELMNKKIVLAKNPCSENFSETITPFLEQVDLLKKKNTTLRQTRDLLLPRLITGAVDVSALEIAGLET